MSGLSPPKESPGVSCHFHIFGQFIAAHQRWQRAHWLEILGLAGLVDVLSVLRPEAP